MEKLKRALELARRQREQRQDAVETGVTPVAEAIVEATEPARSVWRTPVVAVDPDALARERILDAARAGPAAAPYKLLRTQVLRRLEELGATTLAVISPRASDGKTLTAINLGISLGSDPARTALVVDFDLRNPQLATRFGIAPTAGVEESLLDREPVERALVRPRGYERLVLLPACGPVEHSSELLGSTRAGDVVAELRGRYANRIVLFDLPPVLECDDVLAFSRHIQAALLVISEGRTQRQDVARTLNLLRDTPIVGTVLNGSREKPGRSY